MMSHTIPAFPTRLTEIHERMQCIDVVAYTKTRNYVNGAVSYLSPYLSRGVITLPQVKETVLQRYTRQQAHAYIFELTWREYFQRVWWQKGEEILTDIRTPQQPVASHEIPLGVLQAQTGIKVIDEHISLLYATGYMHNHVRMYVASVCCNIAQVHWLLPARWMYYHLLDGDPASNMLSWQWVAGTFSAKKYVANQENINTYTGSKQRGTFLDVPYEKLPLQYIPDALQTTVPLELTTTLPGSDEWHPDYTKPLLLYHTFWLNPEWRKNEEANRLLVLEPSHFEQFPVSKKVLEFIQQLSKNIPGLTIYVGEAGSIPHIEKFPAVYSVAHPTTTHYPGIKEMPPFLFPQVTEAKGSFMNYWKKCERFI